MSFNLLYLHNHPDHPKNIEWIEARELNTYSVETADAACETIRHHPIHLILIDQELTDGNGLDFVHYLREKGLFTPIILVMDKINQYNLLDMINLNNVQCLIRPYTEQNLCDSLKMAVKTADLCHPLAYTDLNFGYFYDPISKHIVASDGAVIKLCNKEALLIELLLQNGEHITNYEMIENIVWQDTFMSIESLRTLIRGIRQKTHPNIITNHNGIGYKISISS